MGRQTGRQADRQEDRQVDKQTDRKTDLFGDDDELFVLAEDVSGSYEDRQTGRPTGKTDR